MPSIPPTLISSSGLIDDQATDPISVPSTKSLAVVPSNVAAMWCQSPLTMPPALDEMTLTPARARWTRMKRVGGITGGTTPVTSSSRMPKPVAPTIESMK